MFFEDLMCPRCLSCDTPGRETYAGSLTKEKCALKCFDDPTCTGIDYGKENRAGECFLNHDMLEHTKSLEDRDFSSWIKKPSGTN